MIRADKFVIICAGCGIPTPRRGQVQKYCEPCSAERDRQRKNRWARNNPPKRLPEALAEYRERRKSQIVTAGIERNDEVNGSTTITWPVDLPEPPMVWFCRFAVPFTYSASKNHIYSGRGGIGHVALRRESRSIRDLIEFETRRFAKESPVVQAKVYIDMLIQKPDHKGDAVNMVDLVCDGVKRGIGVDDRWFCIRRVDWQIVKTKPQMIIGFGQADSENLQVCSHCGIIQPVTAFRRKRSLKFGFDRVCLFCVRSA